MPELNGLPGGWWTAIGGGIGVISAAALYLRQYLSGAAAQRASDAGQITALSVYQQLLADAIKRAAEAESRADGFAKERNEALQNLGRMEGRLAGVQQQLEEALARIADLTAQVTQLREHVDAKA
jgi:flagellar biosynthesis/type III secretory pathway protein FliH